MGTKERKLDELLENNAKLNMEIHKLKENVTHHRKEKSEQRMSQLTVVT